MAGLNRIFIIGNLIRDAEVRATQSGTMVTSLRLASNRRWYNASTKETKESTEFHNIVVWGSRGSSMAAKGYLSKGQQLFIEGHLQTRSYENKAGQKVYVTEIIAGSSNESIQLLNFAQGKQTPVDEAPPPQEDFPDEDLPNDFAE